MLLVDVDGIEGGRVDVVAPVAGEAVDLHLVVHSGGDLETLGRALVAGVQTLYPDADPHVRARLYAGQRESAVAIVSPSGWAKWAAALGASAADGDGATRGHFQTLLLEAYRAPARRHAAAPEGRVATLTHETSFPDGSVVFWSG